MRVTPSQNKDNLEAFLVYFCPDFTRFWSIFVYIICNHFQKTRQLRTTPNQNKTFNKLLILYKGVTLVSSYLV